jgi:hypothetical protein
MDNNESENISAEKEFRKIDSRRSTLAWRFVKRQFVRRLVRRKRWDRAFLQLLPSREDKT